MLMRNRWTRVLALLVLLASAMAGCLGGDPGPGTDAGDDDDVNDGSQPFVAETPNWDVGFAWTYEVETNEFPRTTTTMMTYDDDGNNYRIGTTDRRQALIHSLFNVNPQIGRIQKGNLAVYEDGEPRAMYDFPLEDGKTWTTGLFVSQHGGTLTAEATYSDSISTAMGPMEGFEVQATNPNGFTVTYDYIPEIQWFSKLVVTDADGTQINRLAVQDFTRDGSGKAWFVRGSDIFDRHYASSDCLPNCQESVLVQGESDKDGKYGPYDLVAYNVQVTIPNPDSTDSAEIEIRDGNGDPVYQRSFSLSQKDEFNFNVTRDFAPGDWTIDVTLRGDAEATVRLAGAWEYHGEV